MPTRRGEALVAVAIGMVMEHELFMDVDGLVLFWLTAAGAVSETLKRMSHLVWILLQL